MDSRKKNDFSSKNQRKRVTTFSVPISLEENIYNSIDNPLQLSKEQIIKQAFRFHSQGNISEAVKYYQYFLNQGFNDHRVFSNYGVILGDLGKLEEAELLQRKAIEFKPDYANGHYNLGNTLNNLGKLEEAELLQRKAIELKPGFAKAYSNLGTVLRGLGKLEEAESSHLKALELNPDLTKTYYALSILKCTDNKKGWQDKLFSLEILNNKSKEDQIDIYFARANILHKEQNYDKSSKFLHLANELKLELAKSQADLLIKKSKVLLDVSGEEEIIDKNYKNYSENIFIVGMPRSGSTLLESILSMNSDVDDLGEVNFLEESFLEYKKKNEGLTLADLYLQKVKNNNKQSSVKTNKWLYNFQYVGIIANNIPNAKIIHCYRNPLDNILSIYRTQLAKGNEYSSSLIDCARVYLNQEEVMNKYKNRFRSIIYDLNYDLLVIEPSREIKSLIDWLKWEWDDSYLSPHSNQRLVSTASSVQVRSPINSKSVGGWKNYREMLHPAIEILEKHEKYKNLKFS